MRAALEASRPVFRLRPGDVTFLREPRDYFTQLQSLAAASKRRVFISGLYLGSDDLSKELVASVEDVMIQRPTLKVSMLFDHGRGTREEAPGQTSVTTAMPLIERGAKMHLWRSPNVASWKERLLGKRLSELLGVQHAKVHVFDDTVILSGANLSRSYFEDRKDRYVCIRDGAVADFYYGFLQAAGSVSHCATVSGVVEQGQGEQTGQVLANYYDSQYLQQKSSRKSSDDDNEAVFLVPTLQLGVCALRNDEQTTLKILERIQNGKVVLTSGYFNVAPSYERQLFLLGAKPKVQLSVIVSSPEANSWFNSKGKHSQHVPNGYSWLQAAFMRRIPKLCRLKMLEWKLGDAWSYHCKGLWHFGHDNSVLTIVGSANFGNRSVNLDLEAQAVLFSDNVDFKKALECELEAVESKCESVTLDTVEQESRTPPFIYRMLLPVLKRWM